MTEQIYTCSVLEETTRRNQKDRQWYNYAFKTYALHSTQIIWSYR